MKFYERIGNYLFDYMLITILILISGILIVPIYAGYLGSIAFYEKDSQFKVFFKVIKDNFKNVLYMSLYLLILGLMLYGIVVLEHNGLGDWFLILSRILIISNLVFLLMYPPIVMIIMHVTFKQLLQNSLYLTFRYIKETVMMVVVIIAFVWALQFELWVLLLSVPLIQTIHYISKSVLEKEKNKINERKEQRNEENL